MPRVFTGGNILQVFRAIVYLNAIFVVYLQPVRAYTKESRRDESMNIVDLLSFTRGGQ